MKALAVHALLISGKAALLVYPLLYVSPLSCNVPFPFLGILGGAVLF
jgi:hypothetical protein